MIRAAAAALACLAFDSSGFSEPLDPARCVPVRRLDPGLEPFLSLSISRARGEFCAGRTDGRAEVVDLVRGVKVREIAAHSGYCTAAAFSPDGRWLATAGHDGAARVWHADTGKAARQTRPEPVPLEWLAWAGDVVVAAGEDRVRTLDGEGRAGAFDPKGAVSALDALDGRVLLGHRSGDVSIWDVATGKAGPRARAHDASVAAVAFDATGRRLATADADGSVRLWDASTLAPRAVCAKAETRALVFSASGRVLFAAGRDSVRALEAESGRLLREFPTPGAGSCGLGVGSREIAALGADGSVRVWSGAGGVPFAAPDPEPRGMGFLGVSYVDNGGAFVTGVHVGSQAERTGLRAGDVVVAADAVRFATSDEFFAFMRASKRGDLVRIEVLRDGRPHAVRVKLGRPPSP